MRRRSVTASSTVLAEVQSAMTSSYSTELSLSRQLQSTVDTFSAWQLHVLQPIPPKCNPSTTDRYPPAQYVTPHICSPQTFLERKMMARHHQKSASMGFGECVASAPLAISHSTPSPTSTPSPAQSSSHQSSHCPPSTTSEGQPSIPLLTQEGSPSEGPSPTYSGSVSAPTSATRGCRSDQPSDQLSAAATVAPTPFPLSPLSNRDREYAALRASGGRLAGALRGCVSSDECASRTTPNKCTNVPSTTPALPPTSTHTPLHPSSFTHCVQSNPSRATRVAPRSTQRRLRQGSAGSRNASRTSTRIHDPAVWAAHCASSWKHPKTPPPSTVRSSLPYRSASSRSGDLPAPSIPPTRHGATPRRGLRRGSVQPPLKLFNEGSDTMMPRKHFTSMRGGTAEEACVDGVEHTWGGEQTSIPNANGIRGREVSGGRGGRTTLASPLDASRLRGVRGACPRRASTPPLREGRSVEMSQCAITGSVGDFAASLSLRCSLSGVRSHLPAPPHTPPPPPPAPTTLSVRGCSASAHYAHDFHPSSIDGDVSLRCSSTPTPSPPPASTASSSPSLFTASQCASLRPSLDRRHPTLLQCSPATPQCSASVRTMPSHPLSGVSSCPLMERFSAPNVVATSPSCKPAVCDAMGVVSHMYTLCDVRGAAPSQSQRGSSPRLYGGGIELSTATTSPAADENVDPLSLPFQYSMPLHSRAVSCTSTATPAAWTTAATVNTSVAVAERWGACG